MNLDLRTVRRVAISALVLLLLTGAMSADVSTKNKYDPPPRQQVIAFLTQSIEWYRSSSDQHEIAIQPEDVPFIENAKAVTIQILRLSFDYARAVAALEPDALSSSDRNLGATVTVQSGSEVQHLLKIEAQCEAEVQAARNDIASRRKKIDTQQGHEQTTVKAVLADSESRLKLLQSQCDTYRNLLDFERTTGGSEPQNQGLSSVLDDLSRTVPELDNTGATASSSQAVSSPAVPNATASTIPDLISAALASRRKLDMLDRAARSTDGLAQSSENLKTPLSEYLNSALQNTTLTSNDHQGSSLESLRQQKINLNALSARITTLSPALIALGKQKVLFGIYKSDLARWRALAVSQYVSTWKKLILRLIAFAIVISVLLGVARALSRFTVRYVRDTSHRRTILISERIVLWLCILLIVAFAFGSNLTSLATFFGLLTAGLAVAMQNVILAVLGYMVLVGKLHLHLGDRIQISDVTGEIIELGLLELQVREIDAEGHPTGGVRSFSNCFVFVSPATGICKYGTLRESTMHSDEPVTAAAHEMSVDQRSSKV